jgi:hypothetical protein
MAEHFVISLDRFQAHRGRLQDYAWSWSEPHRGFLAPATEALKKVLLECGCPAIRVSMASAESEPKEPAFAG